MSQSAKPLGAPGARGTDDRVRRIEFLGGRLLSAGLILSLLAVVLGLALCFLQNPAYVSSPDAIKEFTHGGAEFPHTVLSVARGVNEASGPAVVMAGLLLLIVTPALRVAFLLIAFFCERDRAFAIITVVVVALMLVSFVVGAVG
ncbi:MAG: DUF1634 domain-containing protein [Egibacteraceae bacterium]